VYHDTNESKDCVYHEQKKKHEQIKRKLPPIEDEGER
jgi:hypothetical protein